MICLVFWSTVMYPPSLLASVMHVFHRRRDPRKSIIWLQHPALRLQMAIYLKTQRRTGNRKAAADAVNVRNKELKSLTERITWSTTTKG
jgi:hypothetical protein